MAQLRHLIRAVREVLATRDLSTGLLRRAAFERTVDAWVGGGDARRPATTILMIQVGPAGGPREARPDRQLVNRIAGQLHGLLRATDVVGRVDDDTVGVLLPSTPVDQGERAAERILERFRDSIDAREDGLAATIGVASANSSEPWLAALHALRDARAAGGDRILIAPADYAAAPATVG